MLRNAIQQNRLRSLNTTNNKPQYPSMGQMAKNLGNDIIKNVKSVAAGNPVNADENEVNRRRGICNGCSYFDKGQERCTKCGCYMAVKVYLKASSCPVGKW
jgi:hypothetical protein